MTNLEKKMKSNKEVMFDKEYVKVKKETFDIMNHVFKENSSNKENKKRFNANLLVGIQEIL